MKFLTVVLVVIGIGVFFIQGRLVLQNNEATKSFVGGQKYLAYKGFSELMVQNSENSTVLYNMGIAFLGNEEVDKAAKQFGISGQKSGGLTRYASFFNQGRIFGDFEKLDESIQGYQNALNTNPDSVEVRANIESLITQSQKSSQGKGESDDKKKDGKGEDEQEPQNSDDPNREYKNQSNNPQPQDFKSQEMSKDDVRKILEELKRQEEKVRANLQKKKTKETGIEKDW